MARFGSCFAVACLVLAARSDTAAGHLRVQDLTEGTDAAFADDTAGPNASPAIAPDGRTLYIAGGSDDSLTALTRDPVTGRVGDVVDIERDGVGGVDGLDRVPDALVSPDSRFVYVAGTDDGAVSVFERTPAPNLLTHRETQKNGIAGVEGLLGPVRPFFGPAAHHLYVLARGSNALAVFAREADGTLEFIESEFLGVNAAPTSGVASPDGRFLYLFEPFFDRITTVARDGATGEVTLVDHFEDGEQGAVLEDIAKLVATDARFLYALRGDSVLRFERDATTGALTYLGEQSLFIGLSDIEFSPSGQLVATGCCSTPLNDALHVFDRDLDTGAFLLPNAGGAALLSLDADHRVAIAREHIYVMDTDGAEPAVLEVLAAPLLDSLESQQDGFASADALEGAFAVAPSPDGRHVYVAGFHDGAVQIFGRTVATGEIDALGEVREGVACTDCLGGVNAVALSPNGAHLYVSASADDAISVFARNATTGALTWVETESDAASACPLDGPTGIAVSPDGRDVLTTASGSGSLCNFGRDTTTGALAFEASHAGAPLSLLGADDIALSADGRNVYVAAAGSDAIAQFSRDPASGDLDPLGAVTDDEGVNALASAAGIAVSHDGRFAYAVGFASDAIAVLSRHPVTGLLTQIGAVVGNGAQFSIDSPRALALSRDGRALLVASESGVVALWRDPADGHLGYAQRTLSYASYDVAVSPDGRNTYATAFSADRVEVYLPEPGAIALGVAAALAVAGLRRFSGSGRARARARP